MDNKNNRQINMFGMIILTQLTIKRINQSHLQQIIIPPISLPINMSLILIIVIERGITIPIILLLIQPILNMTKELLS